MTSKEKLAAILAVAAFAAAHALVVRVHDVFEPEYVLVGADYDTLEPPAGPLADFILTAGGVNGESVYRFAASKGLHFMPPDGYADVSPWVRCFFDAFTATVKALAPVIDPARDKIVPLVPERPKNVLHETIFEPEEGSGARSYAVPNAYVPKVSHGVAGGAAKPVALVPEAAVFQNLGEMSDDQRRVLAAQMGLNSYLSDGVTSVAPSDEGLTFDVDVAKDGVSGTAKVFVPTALGGTFDIPAAPPAADETGAALRPAAPVAAPVPPPAKEKRK